MLFINESKKFVHKGESFTDVILVPFDVMGMPIQIRTGLGLSELTIIDAAALRSIGVA